MAGPTVSVQEASLKAATPKKDRGAVDNYMRGIISWREMVSIIEPAFLTRQSDRANIYIRGGNYFNWDGAKWDEYQTEGLHDDDDPDKLGVLQDPPGPSSPPNIQQRFKIVLPEGMHYGYASPARAQEEPQSEPQDRSQAKSQHSSQGRAGESSENQGHEETEEGSQQEAAASLRRAEEAVALAKEQAKQLAQARLEKLRGRYPFRHAVRRLRTWAGPYRKNDPLTKAQRDLLPKLPRVTRPSLWSQWAAETAQITGSPTNKPEVRRSKRLKAQT
ncbi:MAG: hypothetical protein M1819_006690 [Sarea resinae]|nr:MAG: hypothetical protein M1819_006690 [Sarea resinae]